MKFRLALLALAVFANSALGEEHSFWVWNRTQPLTPAEQAGLKTLGVQTLYWELGELQNTSGRWTWKRPPLASLPEASPFRIVPVLRLESSVKAPFEHLEGLLSLIEAALPAGKAASVQIDYDAPDRLLPDYASFLRQLRPRVAHLSASALAGWVDLPAFPTLQDSVEELFPMFYDLVPDTGLHPIPLLEPSPTSALIGKWERACRIPWQAGLPTFARLSVYESSGASRGHIPVWSWDEVCFNRNLAVVQNTTGGLTIFRATADTAIGQYPIGSGQLVVARWPARSALIEVQKGLARPVIYFRLPEDSAPGGWTLDQLAGLTFGAPTQLRLRKSPGGGLQLINDSTTDLEPRLSGENENDRGYALEIDAPGPIFRDGEAGDFWRLTSHRDPESHPIPVPLPLATRLTFWFAALPAHHTLDIKILRLASGQDLGRLRYRILHGPESTANWQIIDP